MTASVALGSRLQASVPLPQGKKYTSIRHSFGGGSITTPREYDDESCPNFRPILQLEIVGTYHIAGFTV